MRMVGPLLMVEFAVTEGVVVLLNSIGLRLGQH